MLTKAERRELLKEAHEILSLLMQERFLLGKEGRASWDKECGSVVYHLAKRYVEEYEEGGQQ